MKRIITFFSETLHLEMQYKVRPYSYKKTSWIL